MGAALSSGWAVASVVAEGASVASGSSAVQPAKTVSMAAQRRMERTFFIWIHLLMHRSFCFQNNHIRDETRVSEVAYKS